MRDNRVLLKGNTCPRKRSECWEPLVQPLTIVQVGPTRVILPEGRGKERKPRRVRLTNHCQHAKRDEDFPRIP